MISTKDISIEKFLQSLHVVITLKGSLFKTWKEKHPESYLWL